MSDSWFDLPDSISVFGYPDTEDDPNYDHLRNLGYEEETIRAISVGLFNACEIEESAHLTDEGLTFKCQVCGEHHLTWNGIKMDEVYADVVKSGTYTYSEFLPF